jgi:hypothetical protein
MGAGSWSQNHDLEDAIIAVDKDDLPVVLVETKPMKGAARLGVPQLLEHLHQTDIPFGMFADLEDIRVFHRDTAAPSTPIFMLKTADVLSHYEPEFVNKRIFSDYFDTLIEAWLQDFALHWKSERPPGYEEMAALGLSERLAGGMASPRRALGDHRLY